MKNKNIEEKNYCLPGANDIALRPKTHASYAPRQIAVAVEKDKIWMAWIHYKAGNDFPVVTCRKVGQKNAKLYFLEKTKNKFYSKPALLKRKETKPDIFIAVGTKTKIHLHHYRFISGSFKCIKKLPTICNSIYHTDVIANEDGTIYLTYAGTSQQNKGLCVFTRRFSTSWEHEIAHPLNYYSVNRPQLTLDKSDRVFLVADCFDNNRFKIVFKRLDKYSNWTGIYKDNSDQLFPSIITDSQNQVWLSWLRQTQVEKSKVAGLYQQACVARLDGDNWQLVNNPKKEAVANLNTGLLPIRRYFGYDGLRRYPGLLTLSDGSVVLLWEQQKDEKEIWKNVNNGFVCAKRFDGRRWQRTSVIFDRGCCHCFDSKNVCDPQKIAVIFKNVHRNNGNDFVVENIDINQHLNYKLPSESRWKNYEPVNFKQLCQVSSVRKKSFSKQIGFNLYFGDLHCHGLFSPDAEGESDELFLFAKNSAKLDFAAVTDNDCYPPKALLNSEVHHTNAIAEKFTEAGKFVAFSGYEYTYHKSDRMRTFNHRIVLFADDDLKIIRRNQKAGIFDKDFAKEISKSKNIIFPHHINWQLHNIPNETVVEVTSGWGTYILDSDKIHNALNQGFRFGFLGCSDSHRFMPGLSGAVTGVYAKVLTKAGIIEALKARRCYATTGNRTLLAFWINDSIMGSELKLKKPPLIRWMVYPQTQLEKIEIIRNGKVVHASDELKGAWTDNRISAGQNWYYLKVTEKGKYIRYEHNVAQAWGKWAWSSPIWVHKNLNM